MYTITVESVYQVADLAAKLVKLGMHFECMSHEHDGDMVFTFTLTGGY